MTCFFIFYFFNYINSLHGNIQFTVERENENKLAFLDVSVERLDDSFNLSIFRKQNSHFFRIKLFFICAFNFQIKYLCL